MGTAAPQAAGTRTAAWRRFAGGQVVGRDPGGTAKAPSPMVTVMSCSSLRILMAISPTTLLTPASWVIVLTDGTRPCSLPVWIISRSWSAICSYIGCGLSRSTVSDGRVVTRQRVGTAMVGPAFRGFTRVPYGFSSVIRLPVIAGA